MNTSITYVGMDTHKKEHTVAVHYPGQEEIARFTIRNTPTEIRKLANRIWGIGLFLGTVFLE